MTLQGLPAAKTPSGISRVTTLPGPMTEREPTRTPGQRIAPPPTQTSEPTSYRLGKLLLPPQLCVHRVRGRVNLNRRAEQGEIADSHLADVEHNAVEVEEHVLTQHDVRAIVAEERWLNPDALPPGPEQLSQQMSAFLLLGLAGRVQGLTKVSSPFTGCDELRVQGVVQLPGQHFVSFAQYRIFLRAHVDSDLNFSPVIERFRNSTPE